MTLTIDRCWDGQAALPGEIATVRLTADGAGLVLSVDAPFHRDPPPDAPPGPTWKLWEHEVVELFLVGRGDPVPYLEVELGPHGHHLVLRLDGIREITASTLPLAVDTHRDGDRWTARAALPPALLPPGVHPGATIAVNAAAIHGVGSARRYLSSAPLPGDQPDFHRLHLFGTFTLPSAP